MYCAGRVRILRMSASSSAVVPEDCQWLLRTVYAAHPKRFVQKPPQLPVLPHAVWINPPKEQSASQDRADATSSTARPTGRPVLRVAPETTEGSHHPVATPTYEILHDMLTPSVLTP